ncbi:ROK family transcriptional regulator [Vallitalea sp.]|jgi:predicted NBD/HSP70 family sugar kinase|uniref:ROK family transcriptional regulator n=1 Tax=Vallitalea sp. TaxID=1882829 RepID=UPI0025EDB8FE|nr:ROK family transcriptional regulator [Vallitalea sp.]MCT4686537.1 ROK family protein [Vallitalea sp.]
MFKIENKGKSQIKSRNRIKIYSYILKNGPVSRTDLEKKLGISAPSVSRIVENLKKEKLIREIGKEETSVGRKPIKLVINKNARYIVGISITKTKIYICITNLGADIIYRNINRLDEIESEKDLLNAIDRLITSSLNITKIQKELILGIGIASRGIVDYNTGTILRCYFNYYKEPIRNIKVKDFLQSRYNCEVIIDNNINVELFGNFFLSNNIKDNKKNNILYIYMGEGVGGSIICNNELVRGKNNIAGRISHMIVDPNGVLCNCGGKGHLEAYVSKSAIEKQYLEIKKIKDSEINIFEICKMGNNGDKVCTDIIDDVLEKLAFAIANLQIIISPNTIILAGEIFDYYDCALEKLNEKLQSIIFDKRLYGVELIIRPKKDIMFDHSATALIMNKIFTVE